MLVIIDDLGQQVRRGEHTQCRDDRDPSFNQLKSKARMDNQSTESEVAKEYPRRCGQKRPSVVGLFHSLLVQALPSLVTSPQPAAAHLRPESDAEAPIAKPVAPVLDRLPMPWAGDVTCPSLSAPINSSTMKTMGAYLGLIQ